MPRSVNAVTASSDSEEREGAGVDKQAPASVEWLDAPWSETWAFCAARHNWCTFLGQVCPTPTDASPECLHPTRPHVSHPPS